MVSITPEVREFLMQPAPLIITKANVRATVHRRVYMDYVGVKQFDDKGQLSGELRLVGLFTSAAYTRSAQFIPLLRRKVGYVVEHSGYKPESHSGKALLNVIEQYPRDELFQTDAETLIATAKGILQLEERPRTRLFVRTDKFDRFASALVFIPRDRFNTRVREKVGELLCEVYDGRLSAFYPAFPEGSLVRVHYIIGRMGGETPKPDVDDLERQVLEIVKTWDDRLVEEITAHYEADRVSALRNCYINGVFRCLSGSLRAGPGAWRHRPYRKPERGKRSRHRLLSRPERCGHPAAPQDLSHGRADPAQRPAADPGEHGVEGDRRALLQGQLRRRR